MTTELTCLVLNALWGFALVFIEIQGKTRIAGPAWNMGNRDTAPTFPAWIDRTGRALNNHKENFPLFLTAVLVVHLAGRSNKVTAIAAIVYVIARVLHGGLYIAGVERVRTLLFTIGALATGAIYTQLLFRL